MYVRVPWNDEKILIYASHEADVQWWKWKINSTKAEGFLSCEAVHILNFELVVCTNNKTKWFQKDGYMTTSQRKVKLFYANEKMLKLNLSHCKITAAWDGLRMWKAGSNLFNKEFVDRL